MGLRELFGRRNGHQAVCEFIRLIGLDLTGTAESVAKMAFKQVREGHGALQRAATLREEAQRARDTKFAQASNVETEALLKATAKRDAAVAAANAEFDLEANKAAVARQTDERRAILFLNMSLETANSIEVEGQTTLREAGMILEIIRALPEDLRPDRLLKEQPAAEETPEPETAAA